MAIREPAELTRARQACRLANDLMLDLINGVEAHRILSKALETIPDAEAAKVGINRLVLFHVIIALSKWIEFYDRYKSVLPSDVQGAAKDLRNQVDRRGIRDFRNTVAGHIWDDATNRPLTNKEVESRVSAIVGTDIPAFLLWVNDRDHNRFPDNAVAIIERVKNRLKEEYDLKYDELDS
jgi:hypothetical protein